jgi:hypothetical protein
VSCLVVHMVWRKGHDSVVVQVKTVVHHADSIRGTRAHKIQIWFSVAALVCERWSAASPVGRGARVASTAGVRRPHPHVVGIRLGRASTQ